MQHKVPDSEEAQLWRLARRKDTQDNSMALQLGAMTKLDMFEKIGQIMYGSQLLFTPSFWMTDNLTPSMAAAASQPVPVFFAKQIGILCWGIFMLSLSVRASKESPKTLLQKFDIATSAAWGICAVNTIMNVENFQ